MYRLPLVGAHDSFRAMPMMSIAQRASLKLAICALAVLVYALMFQGTRGLWEPDEGRYANIAVQMLDSGNYLVPALNDDVRHLAKPPLTYWIIAAGVELIGRNEWGVRIPYALAFTATVLLTYGIALRIAPQRPWLAPLIYATSLFSFAAENFVTPDMLLTCWETLAVFGAVLWFDQSRDNPSRRALFLMWCGFALAFLTKGPPGLLPLAVIVCFAVVTRGWRTARALFTIEGSMVFLVVGLGWYVYIVVTQPGALTYFLQQEVVARVATSAFKRNSEWYGALLVYAPTLLVGALPWNIALLRQIKWAPATLFSKSWWRDRAANDPWVVFLALWTLLPLAVFIVSKSRLPLYVLPLFVPLSLASARLLQSIRFGRATRAALTVWVLALICLKLAAAYYPTPKDSRVAARAINAALSAHPSEVVFVDTNPYWGLHLYLNCEVEQVVSTPTISTTPHVETLAEELAGHKSVLLVVEKPATAAIESKIAALGRQSHLVGETSRYALISIDASA